MKSLEDAAVMARILSGVDPDYPLRDDQATMVFAKVREARRPIVHNQQLRLEAAEG